MPEYDKDEALAFINAMRMTLEGKVGFRWMTEKLSGLAQFVESMAAENERLNAYIDATDARAEYEDYSCDGNKEGDAQNEA